MIHLIKKYLELRHVKKIKKSLIHIGLGCEFNRLSSIHLNDNSSAEDIIIEDNVWIFGTIVSSNHGKVIMKKNSKIYQGSLIGSSNSVTVGENTVIALNVTIMDNNNHPINPFDRQIMVNTPLGSDKKQWKYSVSSPIVIGDNVWVCSNSRINKGVKIGNNSIVAANAVVTKDVPENSIVAGNPARVVKTDIHLTPRYFAD